MACVPVIVKRAAINNKMADEAYRFQLRDCSMKIAPAYRSAYTPNIQKTAL